MGDITHRGDIELLVNAFYERVIPDPLIGVFFTKVANFSFEHHIPIMVRFWESVLLDAGTYKGNPMIRHVQLHQVIPLEHTHFERWLELWKQTVSAHFEGPVADEAVARAHSIAFLMQGKLAQYGKPGIN